LVAEPVTTLTDYALAGVAAVLCFFILKNNRAISARLWALAFAALAVAAFLGGTFHGLQIEGLWKPTVLVMGVASFGMLAGSAYTTATGNVRRALVIAAALKLALYEAWVLGHDEFIFVVADTASAFFAVAALHLLRLDNPASRWILGGVALSLVAAAIQAGKVALHQHFNHNDLYHVVQIVAMLFFYAGAQRMADFSGSPARR
jgi:uncharacterized protein DUF6962